jgi:hypothetical protein
MKLKTAIHTAAFILPAFFVNTSVANVTDSDAAGETKTQIENLMEQEAEPGVAINALIGLGAFEKTGASSQESSDQAVAGGITFDIGDKARVIETGLTYFQTNTKAGDTEINSGYLAIPLNAKFYTSGNSSGVYIKGGMLTSFLIDTNRANETRNLDMIGNIGVGSKIKTGQNYDVIIEGTYNRGFMDTLKAKGDTYNQGLLIIGGLAFQI